ncbi:hypothetical protein WICPIJ_008065 [Wickerhamomyces pijperi]|uniref:Uncharacterized protein n=1 Tax=Wickerhamomyces pijperi TaxID=599730 RepID=A0A9P8PYF4_WICPI|nr:hypothetical protein WICPIJ_008065 [Wickerhamomyces pijperi]
MVWVTVCGESQVGKENTEERNTGLVRDEPQMFSVFTEVSGGVHQVVELVHQVENALRNSVPSLLQTVDRRRVQGRDDGCHG